MAPRLDPKSIFGFYEFSDHHCSGSPSRACHVDSIAPVAPLFHQFLYAYKLSLHNGKVTPVYRHSSRGKEEIGAIKPAKLNLSELTYLILNNLAKLNQNKV